MASKTKQTTVAQKNISAGPSISLRILALLGAGSAYSRESAIKFSTIARELCLDTDEVRYHCQSLCAPGFAVLELSGIDVDQKTTSAYIETDPKVIHNHALGLEGRAIQIRGRAKYMQRCARAVAVACHPWMDLAAPASDSRAG